FSVKVNATLVTIHIFLEYVAAFFVIKNVRKNDQIPQSSRVFMYGAVGMLIISSIGPFALGGIASQGLRESAIFEMAIYFYLHFQYTGLLFFLIVGMFILMFHKMMVMFSVKRIRYCL